MTGTHTYINNKKKTNYYEETSFFDTFENRICRRL